MKKHFIHYFVLILSVFTLSACNESDELIAEKIISENSIEKSELASERIAKIKLEEREEYQKKRLREYCINKKYLGQTDSKCEDLN